MKDKTDEREQLKLSDAAEHLLDECRMVLPGIQALFGFQLIAVFSPGFKESLGTTEQCLHLVAMILVIIATAMIMTPAAYHRQTGPQEVTKAFVNLSTRLLLWSMWPLMLGICIDFYVIAQVIVDRVASISLAVALLMVFILLWFVLPRSRMLKAIAGKTH